MISSQTSGVDELANLTDVNISQIQDGQILKWDSTSSKWVNTSEAEVRTQLSLLEDVDIDDTTLADGQVLKYNGTSEKWENGEGGDVLGYDETLDVLGLPPNPVYRMREGVPVMTSNTTPEGECGASSSNSNFPPYYAFRQVTYNRSTSGTFWAANSAGDAYLYYKFTEPKEVAKYKFACDNPTAVTGLKVTPIGSNDGTTWTELGSYREFDYNTSRTVYEFDVQNPDRYLYFGIKFTNMQSQSARCGEVQFYERYLA